MSQDKGKVAIVGSGLIGRGWAMLFASGGYRVSLFDVDLDQMKRAEEHIKRQMTDLEAKGDLRGELSAAEQQELISVTDSLMDCIHGAIHVQECTPEILDLKRKVFADLDRYADDTVVLASSSSAMPSSSFAENLKHRSHVLVAHPVSVVKQLYSNVNPPYFMPLVELVPAPWTDPEVVSRTRALMKDIGQSPVTLKKEIPGFIQPRIQYALLQQAIKLVIDGVISAEGIDKILTDGLGTRYTFMGPFETIHLNAEGVNSYIERYADMIFEISNESGPMVPMKDNPDMIPIFDEMNKLVPLSKLNEKRRRRDEGIARVSKLKNDLDRKNAQS